MITRQQLLALRYNQHLQRIGMVTVQFGKPSVVSRKSVAEVAFSGVSWVMRTGRPKATLELTSEEQTQLKSLASSRTLPHSLVSRAKLVLWSAAGQTNAAIAQRLGWKDSTVSKWRQRFVEHRVAGLYDELRSGRPRSIEDDEIAALLKRTLSRKPTGGTRWSVREARPAANPSPRCIASSKRLRSNRIGPATSNSLQTRSSSRRYAILSGSI